MGERIVLDTNTWLGNVVGSDVESRVMAKVIRNCHIVVVSEELIHEYACVLSEKGFPGIVLNLEMNKLSIYKKHKAVDCTRKIEELKQVKRPDVRRVRKDLHVIATALAGKCQILVTSNGPLQNTRGFLLRYGIDIKSPSDFLAMP